jgi:hypothetical protein
MEFSKAFDCDKEKIVDDKQAVGVGVGVGVGVVKWFI